MSITRWDPFRDMMTLREAMSNLLEDSYVAPRSASSLTSGAGNLALDVHESGNEFVITAALPGVNPDDVNINVLGSTVRIHGEFKPQAPQGESQPEQNGQNGQNGVQATDGAAHESGRRQGRWLARERRYGSFDRVVTLPTAVKADTAQAQFENGVLTLTLPKAEEAKPRAIKINTHPAINSTATDSTPAATAATATTQG